MKIEIIGIIISIITLIVLFITLIFVIKNRKQNSANISESDLKKIRESLSEVVNNLSSSISSLVAEKNLSIMNDLSKQNEDIDKKMTALIESQEKSIRELNLKTEKILDEFNEFREKTVQNDKTFVKETNENIGKIVNEIANFKLEFTKEHAIQKDEIMQKLSDEIKSFNEEVNKALESSDKSLKEKLEDFKISTKESINELKENVNNNLNKIREDNNEKLEQINVSVNEKLQKTLEEKLRDSFKSVIDGIGSVNQAVGEIKGLATDVGSLKNVLTNVKTKGIMGEVILGNIIREFLTAGQFVENVATKRGSTERVEFAIILPGTKDDKIYLPVDSKFPYDAYSIIHESSDIDVINEAKKKLRNNLLKYAKDVSEKYIDVPNTTDFAIIFLPLEGLYLEALNMGLFEEIQSKYKVNLTGPTTFTAFINSLNMGFRSLMIQKKSADVFKLLGAVKTEFGKFADALEKTQKKVDDASKELDSLVGTRTRMINSKLKSIDALDDETTKMLIDDKIE